METPGPPAPPTRGRRTRRNRRCRRRCRRTCRTRAPRRRCQHIRPKSLQKESEQRPPDWKPPPPPKTEGPIEARAVRATYVDEIDSDDSDDDEREWSLRHALDEFGVTKVRVKGKQGVALFGSEKDALQRRFARASVGGRLAPLDVLGARGRVRQNKYYYFNGLMIKILTKVLSTENRAHRSSSQRGRRLAYMSG